VRKRVALPQTPFRRDVFVASRERNRLEAYERNLLGVFHRELYDRPHLIVVHVVDDGHHQHDLNSGLVHVLNRAQLHVKQVADLPVAVRVVADAVELQVRVAHPRFKSLLAELLALGELNSVRRRLHAVVANLPRVGHSFQEMRAHRRLAAAELHGHLAARLDLQRVVQNLGDFRPAQLMHIPNLVGVHEARIAHHVAAVGQVHGQH